MEEKKVVNEELTTPQASEAETPKVEKEAEPQSAPGSKTPPELLLIKLQEEREKRQRLEGKLEALEEKLIASTPSEEYHSDEAVALKQEITAVQDELKRIREERDLERVYTTYPVLKEKQAEFDEYRAEYPRTKLENVAKLFLTEQGAYEQPRMGLEKATGGDRKPTPSGITVEDAKTIRETNPAKYREMVKKGLINIID